MDRSERPFDCHHVGIRVLGVAWFGERGLASQGRLMGQAMRRDAGGQGPIQGLDGHHLRRAHRAPGRTASSESLHSRHTSVAGTLRGGGKTERPPRRQRTTLRDPVPPSSADGLERPVLFQGGGGTNGVVGNAVGPLQGQQPAVALGLGYAVVSHDSGHDNTVNDDPTRSGTATFGFDPQARVDFGYRSYDLVTQLAKALITRYYTRPPARSYYVGCSEGGREGMMVSQRFPTHFDGVLSCAPGFRLPRAAVAEAWDSQIFARAAREAGLVDGQEHVLINKTFTDDDLELVSNAALAACDGLDGLADGMVNDFTACTTARVEPKLEEATCRGPKGTCLSAGQVTALKTVFDGARTSTGEMVYAPWAWDAGIGGKVGTVYNQGWRFWKLGPFEGPAYSALNLTLGARSLAAVFVTPPVPVASTGVSQAAYSLELRHRLGSAGIVGHDRDLPRIGTAVHEGRRDRSLGLQGAGRKAHHRAWGQRSRVLDSRHRQLVE